MLCVKIFYLNADTSAESAEQNIEGWLDNNDPIIIRYILQSSEDDDTIISIWYEEK